MTMQFNALGYAQNQYWNTMLTPAVPQQTRILYYTYQLYNAKTFYDYYNSFYALYNAMYR